MRTQTTDFLISKIAEEDLIEIYPLIAVEGGSCLWPTKLDLSFREKSVRSNPRQSKIEAVYATHLDAVHISKVKKAVFSVQADQGEQYSAFSQVDETAAQINQKKEKMRELGRDPDIYERLAKSFGYILCEFCEFIFLLLSPIDLGDG